MTRLLASWAACSCSQHVGVIFWITSIGTGGIITLSKTLLCWEYIHSFTHSLLPAYLFTPLVTSDKRPDHSCVFGRYLHCILDSCLSVSYEFNDQRACDPWMVNIEVLTASIATELVVTVQQCRRTGLNKATCLFICYEWNVSTSDGKIDLRAYVLTCL